MRTRLADITTPLVVSVGWDEHDSGFRTVLRVLTSSPPGLGVVVMRATPAGNQAAKRSDGWSIPGGVLRNPASQIRPKMRVLINRREGCSGDRRRRPRSLAARDLSVVIPPPTCVM